MRLADFVIAALVAFAGITVGIGAAMLLAPPPINVRITKVLFWTGALSFGSLGIVWAQTSEGYSLPVRMLVAAVCAGVAAAGLVWALNELKTRASGLSYLEKPPQSEQGENSPNISAGGNITIGHIGDVINVPVAQTPKRPLDEKPPGFGNGMVVKTDDVQAARRKFQYAFRAPDGAKVAFYLSASNRYAFSVTDINGDEYKLDIPLGVNGLPFGKWAYIFCEVGTASSYSYLRAMLNGKEVARRDFDFPLDLGSRRWMPVLGADANGQNGGAFMMTEMGYYSTTLTDAELMALAKNALNAYGIEP
jgi:hypothetical protein